MQQKHTEQHSSSGTSRHPLWLLSGFWFCFVIAIAVVFRRLIELVRPSHGRPAQMASIDATFSSHAVLTAMHIIPAAIFVVLAAGVLLRRSGDLTILAWLAGGIGGRGWFELDWAAAYVALGIVGAVVGGWIMAAVGGQGVPDVLRFGFAPLYTRYVDAHDAATVFCPGPDSEIVMLAIVVPSSFSPLLTPDRL